jgi:uncharacterized protein
MKKILGTNVNGIKVTDKFWRDYMDVVRNEVIPYQWKALNDQIPDAAPSHAIENFRIAAGESEGEFDGRVFQDSDVAKWLEAVAYSLETGPNPELEEIADSVIALIGRAQQEDGYLDTYFIIKEPEKRWTNLRDWHELYCAGHMIEAAVAYYEATGKRELLDIMCRYADYIDSIFGPEEGKLRGYPGHQEIELALLRLYRATGNERYLNLSQFFINERGQSPHYFDIEKEKRGDDRKFFYKDRYGEYSYNQSHMPVREQEEAVGHAVRAMYMYTAMADLAKETNDASLKKACERLWNNVTQRQMYITGGIGSTHHGEAFSFDYDLPNDTCYTETCASIGFVFWANRMLELEKDGQYADFMERALYNGTISGMDLDGKKFFYVNPLEVHPKTSENRRDIAHVKSERQKWFTCACCPPNLSRLIASIGHYIYSNSDKEIFINLYVGSEATFEMAGRTVRINQESNYPWDGEIKLSVSLDEATDFTLATRIPGWTKGAILKVNGEIVDLDECTKKGYAYINRLWNDGDEVDLILPMVPEKMKANPKVRANVGKVAIQRGPIVYCLEEVDNEIGRASCRERV